MTAAERDNSAIADYLRKRLDYLQGCKADIENRLRDEVHEFINACDDDNCRTYCDYINRVVRHTFRYCMLIAVCSFLEESVKSLCEVSVPNYSATLNAIRRGNWLSKHRRLLRSHKKVDVAGIGGHLDTMEDFVAVRNCIVHAWGKLDKCRNKEQLRDIVQRRSDLFEWSADGFLVVGQDAVSTAIVSTRSLVNKLLEDLLGVPR